MEQEEENIGKGGKLDHPPVRRRKFKGVDRRPGGRRRGGALCGHGH